jgi:nicotinamidase-related amidase
MKKILIVVDMQNDFIDGSLGTPEAEAIVDRVVAKMGEYTKDCFHHNLSCLKQIVFS